MHTKKKHGGKQDRIDCSFAVLLAVMSNLVFWIPVTRYVVIPLTGRMYGGKRQDR